MSIKKEQLDMSRSFFVLDKRIGSEENTHFDTNAVLKNVQLGLTLTNLFTILKIEFVMVRSNRIDVVDEVV
jgi:hypothetical protein